MTRILKQSNSLDLVAIPSYSDSTTGRNISSNATELMLSTGFARAMGGISRLAEGANLLEFLKERKAASLV